MAKRTATLSTARMAKEGRGDKDGVEDLLKKVEEEPKKRLNADIPESLHARFKARVAQERRKMNDVLTELLEEYLSK